MTLSPKNHRREDPRPVIPGPAQPQQPPTQRELVIASLLRCPDAPVNDDAA
jgi:hypothetical protein